MPFDSRQDADQTNFRALEPIDWPQAESFRIGAAPTFFSAVETSYESLERTATFAYRTHALNCCPCGQDHSAELLAHKISLSVGAAETGVRLVSEGTQYAPDGSPERATVIIPGEVGSTPGTAGTLAIGDTIISQIEVSGDQDWFAVQLQAGVTYEFTLNGTGGNALSDPFLEIMSAAGVSLKTNDDGGAGLNSLLRFTAPTSGTFYVNAHGWADTAGVTSTGTYALTATEAPPLPTYTIDQIAAYLANGTSSGLGPRWQTTTITYNIEDLTPIEREMAERGLQIWAAVTPLNFVRTTGSAQITFVNAVADDPNHNPGEVGQQAAYARTSTSGNSIIASTIVVTSGWSISAGGQGFDSYQQQTYIHEIGHALGLGHGGPYGGSADYGTDNIYTNDNWAFTVMSYFDQMESGHGSYRYVLGLQQADIAAMHLLYGTNPAGTHAGNTTFGFNSTAPGTNIDWSQFVLVQAEGTYRRPPSMTIYDTGGIDTINLSGFSQPQILDLRPGTFSSLGDRPIASQPHYSNVIAIEANTIIENAVGGAGNDRIIGNSANNTITLGAGADTFVYAPGGGADTITDFAVSVDRIDLTAFSSAVALAAFNGRTASSGGTLLTFGAGQTILLQGVSTGQLTQTNLVLSGSPPPPGDNSIVGTEEADVLYGTSGNDQIQGLGGNDTLYGLGGNDVLLGGNGNDTLVGGPGADTLDGGPGDDYFYVDVLDTIIGGSGYDTVIVEDLYAGPLVLHLGSAGIERVLATHLADTLDASTSSVAVVLYGFGGADTLIGGAGDDYLYFDYEDIASGTLWGGGGYDYLLNNSPSSYTGTVSVVLAAHGAEGYYGSAG
ncbi:MAG: M10 family metallopeptidase C-terminal domain-containing protein, partial [Hyphomonas sp.]|nr:M10 family metallopeptidase C-terminal domain-containing protein [Hyphomonas sp.]